MNRISVEEFREAEKMPLIVVLDDVRSMYNIGSVFRTCDAFRVEAIYLCGITACPPHQPTTKIAGEFIFLSWLFMPQRIGLYQRRTEGIQNLREQLPMVYQAQYQPQELLLRDHTPNHILHKHTLP